MVLGYKENVNLAQIRAFTEMDSHEERVYNQIQMVCLINITFDYFFYLGKNNILILKAQQRAAQNTMAEKVKEIQKAKLNKTLGKESSKFVKDKSISVIYHWILTCYFSEFKSFI